ncbi:DNA-binding transcriptional regulator, AcrR family [Amycolatopsis sacchari]|uniref:DNA-binding transcriptional regulator, AcrR family n=1 Tax=Amycolatopsis sacchari TaxID=115433 RepID=A0A1I3JTS7_9PSEU|nr:TetR/AcrR family transcriptional regulator [Amycolatopsis sacchari]SFI63667.1 DNA-binding transcriptional regulator, AcrR family [Amycolatopsis sacchari]
MKTYSPRERMVFSAAQLIRTQGVSGTGMREVVARAEAPRGSLQHYFPGGKEQLVDEAIAWTGTYVAKKVRQYADRLVEKTPARLYEALVAQWRDEFTLAGFATGCPLVAATADTVAASERLRAAVSKAFRNWHGPLAEELTAMGVPAGRAASLALVMISALEGAIVLARAHQDVAPLDTVVKELGPLLDGAVEHV